LSGGEANWRPIDTLWGVRFAAFESIAKHVRGAGAKSLARSSAERPRRVKPKGAASGRRAKHVFDYQGCSGGSKPRNRGLAGRPSRFGGGYNAG